MAGDKKAFLTSPLCGIAQGSSAFKLLYILKHLTQLTQIIAAGS